MWSLAVILLLVAASICGTLGGVDTSVGQQGPHQAQEWGVWTEPVAEPLDVEEDGRPVPATRLRRRRRKRIRPYNQDVLDSTDYDEHPVPLRPTRPRFNGEDNQEPLVFPEERPYRARPRRRRLKPRQRLPALREEPLFEEGQEVPWREDDVYHGGRQHTRRPVVDEYVPVPRPRSRKRRPPQEQYLDYPTSELGQSQHVPREPLQSSKEVMIYGDDPVLAPTHEEGRVEQHSTTRQPDVQHHKEFVPTSTERVNTFRPSKPRRLTSPPPLYSTTRADTVYGTSPTATPVRKYTSTSTPTSAVELADLDHQLLLPTQHMNETEITASNIPVTLVLGSPDTGDALHEHSRYITKKAQKTDTHVGELTSLIRPRPTQRASGSTNAKTSMQRNVPSRQHVTNTVLHTPARQPLAPLDVQESSDIDPMQRSQEKEYVHKDRNSLPPTMLPPPVTIKLDPRIKSIEELIQKTRQSLEPALGIHVPNTSQDDKPMKKTIPLSTPQPATPSLEAIKALIEGEQIKLHLQHPRDRILQLLLSEGRPSKTSLHAAPNLEATKEHVEGDEQMKTHLQHPQDKILELMQSDGRPMNTSSLPAAPNLEATREHSEGEAMKHNLQHPRDKIFELLQLDGRPTTTIQPSSPLPTTFKEHAEDGQSTELQLQQPRDEILELLRSEEGSTRLARILHSRNMTLEELLAHRERGSSQQHLSDIFSTTTGTPTSPASEQRENCTSQQTTHQPQFTTQHSDPSTLNPFVAKLFEQTSRRTSRMFTTTKPQRNTDKLPDKDKYSPVWKTLQPHLIGIHVEMGDHQEEDVSTSYKKVDLDDDDGSLQKGETAGKVDKVLTNDPAVNFVEVEEQKYQQYEDEESENIVLGGFSVPVKSGIIASCVILLVTVLVFVGILVGCRWRQRRARRRYVEGIIGARERSTSLDELRGKRAGRSHTPVLVGARDLYGRTSENRSYYLWATIRKTLRYK